MRRIVLWGALAATATLAILSAVGAFLGAKTAAAMFNSMPLAVFWIILAALLAAGVACSGRLIRSPGLLAGHLGPLLVLIGAMVGSQAGHDLRNTLFGDRKTRSGYMVVSRQHSTGDLLDESLRVIGRLPFSLQLKDFWIEYYDKWLLAAIVPSPDRTGGNAEEIHLIDWRIGRDSPIGGTDTTVRVLEYIDKARIIYPHGTPAALRITPMRGPTVFLPARAGEHVVLSDPHITVRVVKVYSDLTVTGTGEARRVVDGPGAGNNPGAKVEITHEDGTKDAGFVLQRRAAHPMLSGTAVAMDYVAARPVGAVADARAHLPAMKLRLSRRGEVRDFWLAPDEVSRRAQAPLWSAPEEPQTRQQPATQAGRDASIFLLEPPGPVKDFKSDLAVLDGQATAARQVVEVNHPLHYGGYHFYQHSCDEKNRRYTVLAVTSDSGIAWVFAGFVMLCAGVFWRFWLRPAGAYLRHRSKRGR